MRRHFEGGGISRCGEISRKYGNPKTSIVLASVSSVVLQLESDVSCDSFIHLSN